MVSCNRLLMHMRMVKLVSEIRQNREVDANYMIGGAFTCADNSDST
jgi:hypothetical protein